MAKFELTRKEALEAAISFIKENTVENENDCMLEVLENMLVQVSKTAKKPPKTVARVANESMAKQLFDTVGDKLFDCAYIMAHTNATTSQKAVAIAEVGIDLGLFEKLKEGKKTVYKAIRASE